MTKYVVTYTWEETCYVEADTPKEAENIADSIEMVALDLELREGKTRVRKATRDERLVMDFVGAEEEEGGELEVEA